MYWKEPTFYNMKVYGFKSLKFRMQKLNVTTAFHRMWLCGAMFNVCTRVIRKYKSSNLWRHRSILWLVIFAYTLSPAKCSHKTDIKNFPMHANDTTMNPSFKQKFFFYTPLYAVSSAGGWIKICLTFYRRYINIRMEIFILRFHRVMKNINLFNVNEKPFGCCGSLLLLVLAVFGSALMLVTYFVNFR